MQKKYRSTALEALAVVKAIEHFDEKPFLVEMDHRALQHLTSSTKLEGKVSKMGTPLIAVQLQHMV